MLNRIPASLGRALSGVRAGEASLTYHHSGFADVPETIRLSTAALTNLDTLALRHTADGDGSSPPIEWQLQGDAASLVLIVEDADSPSREPIVHAIAWNLDPALERLDVGAISADGTLATGRNSYMRLGWLPPDPPTGHGAHRYVFQLFALDRRLGFSGAPGRSALIEAMQGHVLAKGKLTARYERPAARDTTNWTALLLGGAALAGAALGAAALRRQSRAGRARLSLVARFEHQVTGVAVSETGRVFVNFPRWTEDTPVSVAELVAGALRPYPDARWNGWRNARKNELSPADRFVCVQSVVADGRGSLWILDPAAPATSHLVPGGAKLVRVNLATDAVARVYAFGEDVAPEGSYLNDVRFAPDGRTAYITDSGAKGALVVLDIESGRARRLLEGHPSTQPEKDVVVTADGKPLRRSDGRGAEFAADGIEVSPDGAHVYWQALTGRTLYRIAASALLDESLSADALGAAVERIGEVGVSDGYWMDAQGRLYLSAVEENAVKRRVPSGEIETLVRDKRLRWPDSFAQGPDGRIYVTASHIMDNKWFNPAAGSRTATELWHIDEPRR